jgi:hypothetical protein
MEYAKAVIRYFNCNPHCERVLRRIVRWNERASFEWNMKYVNLKSPANVRKFITRFGLKYIGMRKNKTSKPKINPGGLEKLSTLGYTYEQIGRLHRVSKQRIEQIIRKWRNEKRGNHYAKNNH